MEVLVIEKNGREKSYPIDKGVIRVGSASSCDIKLPQIEAPLQLQIFYSVEQPDRCKILNTGPEISIIFQGKRQELPSFRSVEMMGRDEILIDSYRLIFRLPISSGIIHTSTSIDASLSFQDTVLHPDTPNIGTLTLRNTGTNASCQFQVRVSGLPGDCFRLDPAPILHPDAEERFLVYLFHRQRYPTAGFQEVKFIISASQTYPGEEVIIRQQIYVTPVFQTEVELQDDLPNHSIKNHPAATFSQITTDPVEQSSSVLDTPIQQNVEKVRKLEQNVPEEYWT